mgnify:FL=1
MACCYHRAGLYRRLLLLMKAENGVPESWLIRQKKRFGMEHASTEEFLKNVLSAVLPDYPVQNIYDIFSFEEEPAWRMANGSSLKRCSSRGNFDKERHREKAYQHSNRNDLPAGYGL